MGASWAPRQTRPVIIRYRLGRVAIVIALSVGAVALRSPGHIAQEKQEPVDLLIIGAGISGLSAALEAARDGRLGARRGHVHGRRWPRHPVERCGLHRWHAIAGTAQDCRFTSDSQRRTFLPEGKTMTCAGLLPMCATHASGCTDWLTDLGVSFENLARPAGNSVPRLHLARGKGLRLVEPIYRACLRHPNIQFRWAAMAEDRIVR